MSYEKIRTKQYLSYISFCPLRILDNSKFIIMATSLGTNSVVVTRVHCTFKDKTLLPDWQRDKPPIIKKVHFHVRVISLDCLDKHHENTPI